LAGLDQAQPGHHPAIFENLGGTAVAAPHSWREQGKDVSRHYPKTPVPVGVVGIVPVTVGAAGVVAIVVEGTAAQNTVAYG